MRLITLEFEGIGSFADRMSIDFEGLGTAGLFLVEGPTGSGKSTILDAIVFALYGSTAGSNSDLGRMDSHVRQRSRAPYVQLTFEVGGGRYQIRRAPRHQRDKRRGEGTTEDNGSVSLVQLRPQTRDLSHKAREVGDWVIEHIGLTRSQFAATIVLAQGEFASFLDANTEARAQILEKVFGTEFYKDVEDQLAAMRRAAIGRRQRADDAVQETMHRLLGALGLAPGENDLHSVDAELRSLHHELAQAQQRSDSADLAVATAETALRAAEELTITQARKRDLLAQRAELAGRQAQIDQQRRAVGDHERAVPVGPARIAWEQSIAKAERVQVRLAQARQRLARHDLTAASPQRVEELTRTVGTLQAALRAEDDLGALRRAAKAADQQVDAAQARVVSLEQASAQLREQLAGARTAMDMLVEPGEDLSALLREQEQVRAGLDTCSAVAAAQVQLAAAQENHMRAVDAHEKELALLRAAEERRDQDLAASLAVQLRAGDPCLVCGSREHPALAVPSGSDDIGELAHYRSAVQDAADRLRDCEAAVSRGEGVLMTVLKANPQDLDTLRARAESLQVHIDRHRQTLVAMEQGRLAIEDLRDRLEATNAELAQAKLAAQVAKGEQERTAAARLAAQQLVAQARGEHVCVADRIAELRAQVDAMVELIACADAHEQAGEEVLGAEQVLRQTLHALGFEDVATASAALLPEAELQHFRECVAAHDSQRVEVAAGLSEVGEVDLLAEVDLPALQERVATEQERRAQAHEAKGSIEYRLLEATPLRQRLGECIRELEGIRGSTDAVIRMADFATATRSEVLHRVKLSSFVLMRRFQSVVDAANDRLDAISEGRYQLVVETRGLDNRGLAGLDLLVADQQTELSRSTKSLSGGERFYVALALALGLADVVRSESGGVELGTLFIDEGFGSLDAETLEEVLDMLEHVRAGEDRVIGLVSHVDLLKQRIDARISVRRDPQRGAVSTLQVSV